MKKICNRKNKLFCDVILMFAKYVIEKIKEIKTKMCYEIIRKVMNVPMKDSVLLSLNRKKEPRNLEKSRDSRFFFGD